MPVNPPPRTTILIASLCAIPIVVIWNFSASRLWTFRAPKPKVSATPLEREVQPPISAP